MLSHQLQENWIHPQTIFPLEIASWNTPQFEFFNDDGSSFRWYKPVEADLDQGVTQGSDSGPPEIT